MVTQRAYVVKSVVYFITVIMFSNQHCLVSVTMIQNQFYTFILFVHFDFLTWPVKKNSIL